MDGVDPGEAPGVGTPVPGGLTYREAHLAMELLAERGKLARWSWSRSTRSSTTRTQTAELAVELIASALGATIL